MPVSKDGLKIHSFRFLHEISILYCIIFMYILYTFVFLLMIFVVIAKPQTRIKCTFGRIHHVIGINMAMRDYYFVLMRVPCTCIRSKMGQMTRLRVFLLFFFFFWSLLPLIYLSDEHKYKWISCFWNSIVKSISVTRLTT